MNVAVISLLQERALEQQVYKETPAPTCAEEDGCIGGT